MLGNPFDPYQHLFIFAILNDFEEMAIYFWEEGNEQIASALMASKIYRSLADRQKDINKEQKERLLAIKR